MIQNFLPQIEKEALYAAYHKRRFVIFSWAAFGAFIVAIVLLLPPFISASSKVGEINRRQEQAILAAGGQEKLFASPGLVNRKSNLILSFKNLPSVAERIVAISDAEVSGITLASISYGLKDETDPKSIHISLSGLARTRETLLAFQKSVQAVDFVQSVDVPVESFAKGSDLPFSMEISIKQ